MSMMTPEQRAQWSLDHGTGPAGLDAAERAAYDRLAGMDDAQRAAYTRLATQNAPPRPAIPQPAGPVNDGLAVASLVLSLLFLGGLGSLLAVIFGHSSIGAAHREGRQPSGLATAGTILGWIGLVGAVILWAAVIYAAAHSGSTVPCDVSNVNWPNC